MELQEERKDKLFDLVCKMQHEPKYIPDEYDDLSAKNNGYLNYDNASKRCDGKGFNKILIDAKKLRLNNKK